MIKVGILSDTHLGQCTQEFVEHTAHAFAGCSTIIHAGDLTDISILSVFKHQEVLAVCGNTCNFLTQASLPEKKEFILGGYSFGLCHGTGNRMNIEDRMHTLFSEKDCIVFGHSHQPLINHVGNSLLINPGSFRGTGTYGTPGTYAILEIHKNELKASIHTLPTS